MKNNGKCLISSLLALLMLTASVFSVSCSSNETADARLTPAPRYEDTEDSLNLDSFGDSTDAEVQGKVAYMLSENTLYGALEYKNTGDCPITVSTAEFIFTVDGDELRENIDQPSYEYCVVYPGETSYLAAWIELDDGVSYEEVSLTDAVLTYEKADSERMKLTVSDTAVVRNYPSFATVTGTIEYNGNKECPLNMIYLGFYDSDDALIGVWYFTDDTTITQNQTVSFSTHARNLTIEGLAENTARIEAFAFGIG